MKITKMRVKGLKLTKDQQIDVLLTLASKLDKAGFITQVSIDSGTSLKIGLWMRTFKIDTTKHDRNLRSSSGTYKLTSSPTWDQRVEFNNIVNKVLNKFKVSANVKSGPYTIRQGYEAMTENDWYDQKPDWIRQNESNGYYIESIDEKAYLEQRRITRNRLATEKRHQADQRIEQRPHLKLA